MKKVFLKISQNSQENTCARVSFLLKLQAFCDLIRKEILAQVFSCEFCEICKNTYFYRTPLVAASVQMKLKIKFSDWQWSFTLYVIMFQIIKGFWQICQRDSTPPSLSLCRTSFHFSIIKSRQCWCMILAKTTMLIWDKFVKVAVYLIKHTSYNYFKNSEKNTDQAIIFCIVFSFELRDYQLF